MQGEGNGEDEIMGMRRFPEIWLNSFKLMLYQLNVPGANSDSLIKELAACAI